MKLIPRYITTTIISSILLVLLILMGLEILISFIGQLGKIGHGNYGIWQAVIYVCLDMPYQLYNFFPMASLIGSLLGLGILANQSELIIMQASGFSKGQISKTVLKAALIMVAIAMILGEIVAPFTEHLANLDRAIALSGNQALETGHGVWIRQDDKFIHVGMVNNPKHLSNVTAYDFNSQHQLVKSTFAKTAFYRGKHWELTDVKSTEIFKDHTVSSYKSHDTWHTQINPSLLAVSDDSPQNMSLIKLNSYISYLKANGLEATRYQMNFWKRIFQPLATAVMIFLAIPFVFGSLRSVTMGVRVLTGVTIGFLFYILNQFFAPISLLYQVPPLIGASLPTLLFLGAAVIAVFMRKQ